MAQKSKRKGSTYERKVAKLLSEALGVEFIKSPHSGALGTKMNIPGLQGDIIRKDLKEIPYIECKKYKDFRLENFLLKQGNEWAWVTQTLNNITDGRLWCIIFQKDYGRQHWVLTNINIECDSFMFNWGVQLTTLERVIQDETFRDAFL